MLEQVSDPVADEALLDALTHIIPDVRAHAALALAKKKNHRSIPFLLKSLRHPNLLVRRSAIYGLGVLRAYEAVPALFEMFSDFDPEIRGSVAMALGQIGDASIIPALLNTLQSDNPAMRAVALDVLGRLNQSETIEPFIALLGDTNLSTHVLKTSFENGISCPRVSDVAVHVLRSIATSEAIDAIKAFQRKRAIQHLGSMFEDE